MSAPTTLLRPALEAAVQVARAGENADPVQPAPPALRRFLRFARLPAPALDIAPGWFFLVSFAAALPVVLSFRPVWRYDSLAAFTLFVGSVIAGSIGAWWVREYGFAILHWVVTLT